MKTTFLNIDRGLTNKWEPACLMAQYQKEDSENICDQIVNNDAVFLIKIFLDGNHPRQIFPSE